MELLKELELEERIGGGGSSSSLSTSEEVTKEVPSRREEEDGTSTKSCSQAEEGIYANSGLQAETFSLNFTSLLIMFFVKFG